MLPSAVLAARGGPTGQRLPTVRGQADLTRNERAAQQCCFATRETRVLTGRNWRRRQEWWCERTLTAGWRLPAWENRGGELASAAVSPKGRKMRKKGGLTSANRCKEGNGGWSSSGDRKMEPRKGVLVLYAPEWGGAGGREVAPWHAWRGSGAAER
jgi:hypothetical protein